MKEKYYVGAYWPGRVEPVAAYARRASGFFGLLHTIEPSLERWFEKAASRADALRSPIVPSAESLMGLLKAKSRRDAAVSLSAWNGEWDGASTSVRISCGSAAGGLSDLCVMELPTDDDARARVVTAPVLSQLLRAAADSWDAEWGVATSIAHRDSVSEFATPGTFVGWVTYVSRQRGPVPPLPSPVCVEPVGNKGTLIVLTPERFTASNPEHVDLAEQVRASLDRAGMLKPLQA
ncbi:immunity 52 family protein [Myxococcus landrumensis]|uniref:Immunity 52 family protein n=1 Tax=Myxococcus landrumensis TaxID=2813577 RepID=A0ABX7N8Z6_9BACT|nr:immunity 52 family protein [Myxococcus landrumus]QSQ14859.1 immunity 52 family protein [Myxococcus landrumus]